MSRRNIRQESKLKTSLKLTMAVAIAATAGFVFLLIVVFNLAKEEISHAAQGAMIFKNADCIQDSNEVLRGSINQKIIGVMVETSGKGTPVKINTLFFTAKGTSQPINQNIENARLWFTGNEPNFNLNQQVGNTIAKLGNDEFEMECNQNLQTGKNYFWLTFDIKPDAACNPGTIDAQCLKLKSGAIAYQPQTGSPNGKRFTIANIPYYSTGNNVLNNVMSWNSKRDGSGLPPKELTASRNSFFIQSGHHIVNSSPGNLQTVIVEKGGELRITSPLRLNTMNIACNGIVQMDANVTDYYCFTEFRMDNGANYIHNNTGYLPGLHCHFAPQSNQIFYQYGLATLPYHITWGNVTINASSPVNIDLQKNFTTIAGDLEIKKTGKDNYLFCGNSDTLNIGGNLIMSGGKFMGMAGNNEGIMVLNIEKDLTITDGCFYDAGFISNNNSGTVINIKGDVNLVGGVFDFNRSKNAMSSVNICKSESPSRWTQKPACNVVLGNINILSGSNLVLKGEMIGEIAKGRNLKVMEEAQLMCGNTTVNGEGGFILEDKATIGISSSQGINSLVDKGNILTAKRQFNSGGNYLFYGNENPQSTGKFITAPIENTVRNILLNKDRSTQVLFVAQEINVNEQIKINQGEIDQSSNKLQLPRFSEKQ